MAQPLETGKRMVVDLSTMWRDMQVGQSPVFTEEALQAVIEAGNLVVVSNWAAGDRTAKRITGKDEVLQMPHRLAIFTQPFIESRPHNLPEGTAPCYFLVDLVLAPRTVTATDPRGGWKHMERHQLYLIGISDSISELSQELGRVLFSWKGRFRSGEMDDTFRVGADGTLSFHQDFNYPPFAKSTEQRRFDFVATEDDDEVRLIKVDDEETQELARKIVELNSRKPEQPSKLF